MAYRRYFPADGFHIYYQQLLPHLAAAPKPVVTRIDDVSADNSGDK
ncbi:TPA: hypothetical protein ACOEXB_002760 [Yersinia enterocolitica]